MWIFLTPLYMQPPKMHAQRGNTDTKHCIAKASWRERLRTRPTPHLQSFAGECLQQCWLVWNHSSIGYQRTEMSHQSSTRGIVQNECLREKQDLNTWLISCEHILFGWCPHSCSHLTPLCVQSPILWRLRWQLTQGVNDYMASCSPIQSSWHVTLAAFCNLIVDEQKDPGNTRKLWYTRFHHLHILSFKSLLFVEAAVESWSVASYSRQNTCWGAQFGE